MTTDNQYRPELPPMPRALRNRPVVRGYPVPWFVPRLPDGSYDFRVADPGKIAVAVRERRCWICGETLTTYPTFTIGPMCCVNRTSSEPPAHEECAHWSARACPFLNQREQRRRTNDLPGYVDPPGTMLDRQPGVTLVWVSRGWRPFGDGRGGVLFHVGDPKSVAWYAHGRRATRDEVVASIESGLPALRAVAEQDGAEALAELDRRVAVALRLLPKE